MKNWWKLARKLACILTGAFLMINIMAVFHAYNFTHVNDKGAYENRQPEDYTWSEKVMVLFTGAPNYRKKLDRYPISDYSEVIIQDETNLSAWFLSCVESKGTIALFHGYKSNKAAMIERGEFFHSLGYNTLLVDFEGSGDSGGNTCTIGYHEAEQVDRTVQWINLNSMGPVYLFGNSMGAAAVMKYASECDSNDSIPLILECPFNSLIETTEARFESMGVPSFPFAELLVFWGGAINGFNGFDHNPCEYALKISGPILFLHGDKDDRVTQAHMREITDAHVGETKLVSFSNAAHKDYINHNEEEWKQAVEIWLARL